VLTLPRIIESQNGWGQKGPYRSTSSNPRAMDRDIFHQPRVLRAPSNLALSTAREGAATASPRNLGQGLTTLMGKNFFLLSDLNLPSFSLKPSPLVPPLSHPYHKAPGSTRRGPDLIALGEQLHPLVQCVQSRQKTRLQVQREERVKNHQTIKTTYTLLNSLN